MVIMLPSPHNPIPRLLPLDSGDFQPFTFLSKREARILRSIEEEKAATIKIPSNHTTCSKSLGTYHQRHFVTFKLPFVALVKVLVH